MTEQRKKAFNRKTKVAKEMKLSAIEIAEGYHFCIDWDGLMIGPEDNEFSVCYCQGMDKHKGGTKSVIAFIMYDGIRKYKCGAFLGQTAEDRTQAIVYPTKWIAELEARKERIYIWKKEGWNKKVSMIRAEKL